MPIEGLTKRQASVVAEPTAEKQKLNPLVQTFLSSLRKKQSIVQKADGPLIHVSSVISGAAVFYEKLRYSLDYREEHLLRRHAIERTIRRQLEENGNFGEFARPFLVELVQAQYLKNDAVPESTVLKVQNILDRYEVLLELSAKESSDNKKPLKNWLLGLVSAELDDELAPSPEYEALVNFMVSRVIKDDPLVGWSLGSEDNVRLVFIACYRALFAFDPQTLHFFILRKRFPEWSQCSAGEVSVWWPALCQERALIDRALRHQASAKLYRSLKSRAIVFHALKDIAIKIANEFDDIFLNKKRLAAELEEVCSQYYRGSRRRLYRSAVRSTIYIFLTKILLALLAEAPAEQFIFGVVATTPLIINTAFPPALMFLLTVTTRFPGKLNTQRVGQFLTAILYGEEKRLFPQVKKPASSSLFSIGLFSFFYLLTFTLTFGGIIWALSKINFTFIGIAFFLLFLTIVSFFAIRIRQPVQDLFISDRRENILLVLINFFSLPILRVGQFISLTSARLNVFLYLFDYLLEAPFKSFLRLAEDVLGFFREQREDIV